jgi:hypothetical protein
MVLCDAFRLFRRLGVNVHGLDQRGFRTSYIGLIRRYQDTDTEAARELIKNINAAKDVVNKTHYRIGLTDNSAL